MPTPLWRSGQRVTAGQLNAITPKWLPWVPSWTTSTGVHAPDFGNARVACQYTKTGDLVSCSFDVTFGNSTNFGTTPGTGDNWLFGLPVPSANSMADTLGFMTFHHTDAAVLIGRVDLNDANTFRLWIDSGRLDSIAVTSPNLGIVDSLSPWTWANTDSLHGTFQYKAA